MELDFLHPLINELSIDDPYSPADRRIETWRDALDLVLKELEHMTPSADYSTMYHLFLNTSSSAIRYLKSSDLNSESEWLRVRSWLVILANISRIMAPLSKMSHLFSAIHRSITTHLSARGNYTLRDEVIVHIMHDIGNEFIELNPIEYNSKLGVNSPEVIHRIGLYLTHASVPNY